MMSRRISAIVGTVLFIAIPCRELLAEECTSDADCKDDAVCHSSNCRKLSSGETLFRVSLKVPAADSKLFIDGIKVGSLPWEGIVKPGEHHIRIEAAGFMPAEFAGENRPGEVDEAVFDLEPASGAAPVTKVVKDDSMAIDDLDLEEEEPEETEPKDSGIKQINLDSGSLRQIDIGSMPGSEPSKPDMGRYYFAALFGWGYGNAMSKTSVDGVSKIGKAGGGSYQVEMNVGLRVLDDPFFLDLGAAATYGRFTIDEWPYDPDKTGKDDVTEKITFEKLHFGLMPRALLPIAGKVLYFSVEIEAGMAVSHINYIYVDLRGGLAIVPYKLFELRINPIGAEYLQGFNKGAIIFGYTGNVGLAIRFS